MKRKLVIICVVLLLIGTTQRASAQFYNVRLNTLALASGTLNIGGGVTLSDKLSLDVSGY